MLTQIQLARYAQVLLWGLKRGKRSPLRKGAFVLVRFELGGLALAEEVCALLHAEGYVPVPSMLPTPRMEVDALELPAERRVGLLRPGELELYQNISGAISIFAPDSLEHLADVDGRRVALAARARKPVRTIVHEREARLEYGWTLCMMPTHALAEAAGLSYGEYARQIAQACFLDAADPIKRWMELSREAGRICRRLNSFGNARLHVEGEGIDLYLHVGEQRRWVGVSGRNIPSFELYVSPDWRSVNGTYYADLPSYHSGTTVEGVRLNFVNGELRGIEAAGGGPFARRRAALDAGAGRVGEFALVDKRFSRINHFMATTLYDENFGGEHGSMHMALGQSYANTCAGEAGGLDARAADRLGFNRSTLHWDLINTGPRRVSVILPGDSGKTRRMTLYEDGCFIG